MPFDLKYPELLSTVAIYLAGGVSTFILAWATSNIRVFHDNRKRHHEEIKQELFIPLRENLRKSYAPIVDHRSEVVKLRWGSKGIQAGARVTEYPADHGPILYAIDPGNGLEGSLNEALFEDVAKNHNGKLIDHWRLLRDSWTRHARNCETWVDAMASKILDQCGLPPFPSGANDPYVMHFDLAIFSYRRFFRIHPSALKSSEAQGFSMLNDDQKIVAKGNKEQVAQLLRTLEEMNESEQTTFDHLRQESDGLRSELTSLIQQLSYAIAEHKLRGRCSLVPFF